MSKFGGKDVVVWNDGLLQCSDSAYWHEVPVPKTVGNGLGFGAFVSDAVKNSSEDVGYKVALIIGSIFFTALITIYCMAICMKRMYERDLDCAVSNLRRQNAKLIEQNRKLLKTNQNLADAAAKENLESEEDFEALPQDGGVADVVAPAKH